MAEYIERRVTSNALYEVYEYAIRHDVARGLYIPACDVKNIMLRFEKALNSVPTADVAPVVRCKDCEHWGGIVFGNVCRRWSAPLAGMKNCTKADDFCSYGERKETANVENL